MTKQAKSERLFFHAYSEALDSIVTWGSGRIDALSSLHDDTDECICQRTVNAIRKHADTKLRRIDFNERWGYEYGMYTYDEAREAVAIVLNTCDNWERDEAEFKARLAAL